jgi:hypothetical protein
VTTQSRLTSLERRIAPADALLQIIERNACVCGPCSERPGRSWTCARTGETIFTLVLDTPHDPNMPDELEAA